MTNILPDWMIAIQTPLENESPGAHIARCVRAFDGASLIKDKERLFSLYLVNEPTPERAVQVAAMVSNCATGIRCIYKLCSSPVPQFDGPYKIGSAISVLIEAGRENNALIDCHQHPTAWKDIQEGDVMMYASSLAANNWHAEAALGSPDENGNGNHGGFGRANNGCTVEVGHMTTSLGRPLQYIIKADKLGIPFGPPAPTPQPDPTPPPQPTPDPTPTPQPVPAPIVQNQSFIGMILEFIFSVLKTLGLKI